MELWFNSRDHRPPHFHAEKPGVWHVRVRFLRDRSEMFDVEWGKPRAKELREIAALCERNREALLSEWEAKVNVEAPGPER